MSKFIAATHRMSKKSTIHVILIACCKKSEEGADLVGPLIF